MAYQSSSVRTADFSRRALTSIPESIDSETEILDLRDNGIFCLGNIQRLPGLRALYLGRNVLTVMAFTPQFQQLEILDLSDNKLQSLQVGCLTSLHFLNLAGNRISTVEALGGIRKCTSLRALDLSRNEINKNPFSCLQKINNLQLLSLLGNPLEVLSRDIACLPNLIIWNGKAVASKEAEAVTLQQSLPSRGNFVVMQDFISSGGQRDISASTEDVWRGGNTLDAPFSSSQTVLQQEHTSGIARRSSAPVLDSADDMTSGRTSNSSSSEARERRNNEQSQNQHLGLVERQDSANYQPRPPALAERQDSAQILQALAEDEAALTASGQLGDTHGLTRQDSARELGELELRSPSPRSRRAASPRPFTANIPGQNVELQNAFSSTLASPQTAAERPSAQVSSRHDLCVSPRQDSASDRLGHRGSGILDRVSGGSNIDRSPRQDLQNAGPSSLARLNPDLQQPAKQASATGQAGQEMSPPRSESLEAARQLLHSVNSDGRDLPSASPTHNLDEQEGCFRQDSALDTLSDARRAVLSELPQSDYPSVSTSDPLQQARKLFQDSTIATPPTLPRVQAPYSAQVSSDGGNDKLLLKAHQGTGGPLSPFEGPLTPLSPAWTASQLPSNFLQQLPSIESGIPWTLSSSSPNQLSGEQGSLLAEARRVVLGGEGLAKGEASSSIPGAQEGSSRQLEGELGAMQTHSGLINTTGGFTTRDTPFPDSPMAAESSPQRNAASQQAVQAPVDAAGPSR